MNWYKQSQLKAFEPGEYVMRAVDGSEGLEKEADEYDEEYDIPVDPQADAVELGADPVVEDIVPEAVVPESPVVEDMGAEISGKFNNYLSDMKAMIESKAELSLADPEKYENFKTTLILNIGRFNGDLENMLENL
jgi:hypothetical protein